MKVIVAVALVTILSCAGDPAASEEISENNRDRASTMQSPVSNGFTNDFNMHFRLIPAGTFIMGSPANEAGRDIDESQHQVTLSRPFYLQTTEVTQGQWQTVTGSNPAHFSGCGLDCPVERVSWEDVQDFIARLNKLSGRNYRLPTEAEFEYAARAGTTGPLANGELKEIWCAMDEKMNDIGWYCGNAEETTHGTAQKKANSWGLHDMHGNVWEWCQDSWTGGDYSPGPVIDPVRTEPLNGRVIRGGSWNDYAWHARSANRDWCAPGYRNEFIGFRLVLSP